MTTKRMWIATACDDSNIITKDAEDINISWSSSSWDSDEIQFRSKRSKSSKEWIKVGNSFEDSSDLKNITEQIDDSCFSICTRLARYSCRSISNEPEFNLTASPVIGPVKFEELSPVLNHSQTSIADNTSLSPVIAKKSLRHKRRRHTFPTTVNESFSSCISDSECTINYTQQSSCTLSQSFSIDEFSSQQCFEPLFGKVGDCDQSIEPLYYAPPRRKPKKYKKGGFAYQLQKALGKQRTNVDIWKHELYLQKLQELNTNFIDKHLILLLRIVNFWKEFGVTVVLCRLLNDGNSNDIFELLDCKNCLLVIGFNVSDDLRLEHNKKLKLFPPYNSKIIDYKKESMCCYFNVSKLICIQ